MPDQRSLHALLEAGLEAHRRGNLDMAKNAFERALSVAPNNADALNLYGATLLQGRQAARALEYLQRAAHLKRNSPGIVANLAQAVLLFSSVMTKRAKHFAKASSKRPRSLHYPLGSANSLAMLGKFELAEEVLQKLAARFPQSTLVWFNLGNVQRDQHRITEALASYRRAIELDPNEVEARNSLACVLHKSMQFEEAEREYRTCLDVAPDFLIARCNLASVVMDLGRFDEGEMLCRDVISRAPTSRSRIRFSASR